MLHLLQAHLPEITAHLLMNSGEAACFFSGAPFVLLRTAQKKTISSTHHVST